MNFEQQNFIEYFARRLFSHILTMHAQISTQILLKKRKQKYVIPNKYIKFCLRLDKIHYIIELSKDKV